MGVVQDGADRRDPHTCWGSRLAVFITPPRQYFLFLCVRLILLAVFRVINSQYRVTCLLIFNNLMVVVSGFLFKDRYLVMTDFELGFDRNSVVQLLVSYDGVSISGPCSRAANLPGLSTLLSGS